MKSTMEEPIQKTNIKNWNSKKKAKSFFDELVLYEARDYMSRQKLISHFGVDCAIRTGAGSRLKLENIYGGSHANVTSRRRKSESSIPIRWTLTEVNSLINNNNNQSQQQQQQQQQQPQQPQQPNFIEIQQASLLDPMVQPVALQKLYDIFGRDAEIDISFEEIEKYGLGYLIQSCVPLACFIEYLLVQGKPEILFFFLDVILFEETIFQDANTSFKVSQDLLMTYLCSDSPLECKISSRTRSNCIKAIKTGQRRCFKASQQELLPILEDQFDDFSSSKKYSELKSCYGHLNAYPEKARKDLIEKLISTTKRRYPIETAETNEQMKTNKAILHKVQDFCKTRLSNNNSFQNKSSRKN